MNDTALKEETLGMWAGHRSIIFSIVFCINSAPMLGHQGLGIAGSKGNPSDLPG